MVRHNLRVRVIILSIISSDKSEEADSLIRGAGGAGAPLTSMTAGEDIKQTRGSRAQNLTKRKQYAWQTRGFKLGNTKRGRNAIEPFHGGDGYGLQADTHVKAGIKARAGHACARQCTYKVQFSIFFYSSQAV